MKMRNRLTSILACVCMVFLLALAVVPMFSLTASAADGTWTLVTDVSKLKAGDQIVIASGANALSTTQNSNNRGTTSVTKSGNTITISAKTEIITLEAGSTSGTFAFKTTSSNKYLYCASTSTKNYLREQTTIDAKASWKLTQSGENVNIVSQVSGITRNVLMYNSNSSCFACYKSGQEAVQIYKFVAAAAECDKTQYTSVVTPATCTEAGYTTYTCTVCEDHVWTEEGDPALNHDFTEFVETVAPTKTKEGYDVYKCVRCEQTEKKNVVPAIGYKASFVVPAGVDAVADAQGLTVSLPTNVAVPAGKDGYTFAGWATEELTDAAAADFTLYTEEAELDDDTVFYAVYKLAGEGADGWVEKDITEIAATDVVVVTMTSSSNVTYALYNGNGTSKAPTAVVVTVNGNALASDPDETLKWNIGGDASGYIFYPNGSTDTWLYCKSTNNGVRVGNNEANTFVVDGTTGYLKHTGTSRYVGAYIINDTAPVENPDWRCYNNTTGNTKNQTLAFYVLASSATYSTFEAAVPATINGANVYLGTSLAIQYTVVLGDGLDIADFSMKFTMNGKETVVPTATGSAGVYVFTFDGIAPQQMCDNVKAELVCDGETVASMDDYSIKTNAENLLGSTSDADTTALLTALLHYGAAAQNYKNYNTGTLANENADAINPESPATSYTIDNSTGTVSFKSAGVWFDSANKIYVKLNATDVANVAVKVNGTEASIVEEGGVYVVYTDALYATDFDTDYTFELYEDDVKVQTLTYSVNAYVTNKWNSTSMAELAKALYYYGYTADVYAQ